jgi:hypothetical protein
MSGDPTNVFDAVKTADPFSVPDSNSSNFVRTSDTTKGHFAANRDVGVRFPLLMNLWVGSITFVAAKAVRSNLFQNKTSVVSACVLVRTNVSITPNGNDASIPRLFTIPILTLHKIGQLTEQFSRTTGRR